MSPFSQKIGRQLKHCSPGSGGRLSPASGAVYGAAGSARRECSMTGADPRNGVERDRLQSLCVNPMARIVLCLVTALAMAGCTQASVTSLGNHTFQIRGPGIPGGSAVPNQRVAARVCPDGYRVLHQTVRNNTPDGYSDEPGVFTNWTIRCL